MALVTAIEGITLDGVAQGIGRADEDTRGGFAHGGWGDAYASGDGQEFMAPAMSETTANLFGRRTYDDLVTHWIETRPNPFGDYFLAVQKYVASRNPSAELAYENSTLVVGEAAETVAALKDEMDGGLAIFGSLELVRGLHAAGLVDRYVLSIHPIVMGSGTRLFDVGARRDLRLLRSATTPTGVIMAEYAVDASATS